MREHLPKAMPFYQERPFGEDVNAETYGLYKDGGGNHVMYLAGLLQRYLPGIAHSLYTAISMAYDYAGWRHEAPGFAARNHPDLLDDADYYDEDTDRVGGLPHPMTMGLRTAEYLEYRTTGRLGQHADGESVYTISVAMSNPEDYEGGYFQLLSDSVKFKVPRLTGVVFFSEASHGITPITAGQRRVFVMELWPLDPVPFGMSRPSMQEYLDE